MIGSPILSGEALAQQALLPPLEAMQGEAMQGEAMLDPLLRILNRTALEALIERQHAAALAGDAPFLLLKIDIDYFTRINESYGPAVGDSVLTEVLRALRANLRSDDQIGRYAADEFLLVLPNIALSSGERLARRLNDSVAALRVATSAKSRGCRVSIGCSVSIGIAEWSAATPPTSAQCLIDLAEAALLAAKRHGNCARVGRRPEPVRPS